MRNRLKLSTLEIVAWMIHILDHLRTAGSVDTWIKCIVEEEKKGKKRTLSTDCCTSSSIAPNPVNITLTKIG